MSRILLCLAIVCITSVKCQNWGSLACMVGPNIYYFKLMQQVMTKIEKEIKWCNMKLDDSTQTLDTELYDWHVKGTVKYTNGFTVSIDKIDLTDVAGSFTTRTVDGIAETTASVRGSIRLHGLKIGYDVHAELEDSGSHFFTGVYKYGVVTLHVTIVKNLNTKEYTTITRSGGQTAGYTLMQYMPANRITEALSRHFLRGQAVSSFNKWTNDIIAPMALELAKKTDFPEVRFDRRC